MTNNASKPALDPAFVVRARDAYAIYMGASGGLNYQGQPCSALDDVPESILVNWYTVALRGEQLGDGVLVIDCHGRASCPPPNKRTFAHLPDPARALEIWQRYMGVAVLPPSPAAVLADEMRRGVAQFVSAEQPAAASSATAPSVAEPIGSARAAWRAWLRSEPTTDQPVESRPVPEQPANTGPLPPASGAPAADAPVDLAPTARWVPALTIGGEATLPQRQRNGALYRRLRDGDGTGTFRTSGLAGFVFDVPHERMRVAPDGSSFSFRLEKTDECFRRLLSVISDHFPSRCDADDEVERLRARVAELEARQGGV